MEIIIEQKSINKGRTARDPKYNVSILMVWVHIAVSRTGFLECTSSSWSHLYKLISFILVHVCLCVLECCFKTVWAFKDSFDELYSGFLFLHLTNGLYIVVCMQAKT